MAFTPLDWREIFVKKISYIISNSPLSAANPASVLSTICEATSLEDAEQYFQMIELIRAYSLNSTSGEDLDNRAAEYGLTREEAQYASSVVTIGDSNITKISTAIFSGLSGPKAGDTQLFANDRTNFPNSGTIIIGRGTNNVESIAYGSITEFSNYVRFNLNTTLQNDHGTDEDLILSQGGNRVVAAGTRVKVAENDISEEVLYSIQEDATLLDGEDSIEDVPITAVEAGSAANAPAGLIIEFISKPFSTATVINPERVTNGKDEETDSELRDRIKLHIQGLSRGVKAAIISAITGLEDEDTNKRVVSANIVESNETDQPSVCYIDDGEGFEPTKEGVGFESVLDNATGGEEILQLDNYPLVKAFVLSGESEPFIINTTMQLIVSVNNVSETIELYSSDFNNPLSVSSEEVARQINLKAELIEARTMEDGEKVILHAKALNSENIRVEGGTANDVFGFPTNLNTTLYLYKNYRELLSKDGSTASIESGNSESYSFATNDSLLIKVDNKTGYQIATFAITDTSAQSVVDKINTQIQGATANLTSNNVKVSIVSNVENSSESQIKIGHDGAVTQPISAITFRDSNLPLEFPFVDQVKGLRLLVKTGTYAGNAQEIISYDPTTGQVTLDSSIGGTLGTGDTYVIDGLANGNIGNPANNTNKLNYSTDAATGSNKDFTLNRTQGQIQLSEILSAGDTITAGTPYTRAQIETSNIADFIVAAPGTLIIKIDGAANQTISFSAASYSAAAAAQVINNSILGGSAIVSPNNENKFIIRSNNWNSGTISIEGGTLAATFGLSGSSESLTAHFPHLESSNAEDSNGSSEFTFAEDSNLVLVIDENLNSPFSINMTYEETVTLGDTSAPFNTFRSSSLVTLFQTEDFFKDFFVKFTNGDNENSMAIVLSYNGTNGELVLGSNMTNSIDVGDTFILIPRTSKNVADYLMSTSISGLSLKATTEDLMTKHLTISSVLSGSLGSVNVTGGTANSVTALFTENGQATKCVVSNTIGLMIGQEVVVKDNATAAVYGYITGISGSGPYDIEVSDARSGGAVINLSAYLLSEGAYLAPRNLLGFSTNASYGVDAYSYYTGLLQKVQWTIDGKEEDEETYPGVKAAGTQIEVKAPSINRIRIVVDVTTNSGVSLSSIQADIKNAVSDYVNNLKVSQDVIRAEIIDRIMDVDGVYDADIVDPESNIAVGDEEIVRIQFNDIVVG